MDESHYDTTIEIEAVMKKILGILALLVVVCLYTAWSNPRFYTAYNMQNLLLRTSLFGIISIGAAFVIINGGIDLSIGSVIGFVGTVLAYLLIEAQWSVWLSLCVVTIVSLVIGLIHGLLITKLKLQPFVVTLCGLLIYRGIARWLTADDMIGFGQDFEGLRTLAIGKIPLDQLVSTDYLKSLELADEQFKQLLRNGEYSLAHVPRYLSSSLMLVILTGISWPFVILCFIAVLAWIFLNRTIWGRYMLAIGRNEQAARFSGIQTERMVLLSYVICSLLAGLGGVLFALDTNSVQPTGQGAFYELYAIAAAVLGGCSLRGGEGTIIGVLIGAAVMRVLYNSITLLGIPNQLEFVIIGGVILAGALADEVFRRAAAYRQLRKRKAIAETAKAKT